MNKKRLLAAAKFLHGLKIPRGAKFGMKTFVRHLGSHSPKQGHFCGTSACAIGWLALHRRLGFSTKYNGSPSFDIVHRESYKLNVPAVKRAFRISNYNFEFLFGMSNHDKTPKSVALRIEQFVEDNE